MSTMNTMEKHQSYAPISVMGSHMHHKGELMVSYRFMPMWMTNNINGSKKISNEGIYENFLIAPQTMQMNMHMVGLMYAPSDRVTLVLMGNYLTNTMDLRVKNAVEFTTTSGGIGDATLSGLVSIFNNRDQSLHASLGISIPIGDIDQRDATPLAESAQLAYPMQLGSGTWDPIIGLTYNGQSANIHWGAQTNYRLRTGENDATYTLGNRLDAVGWASYSIAKPLSLSLSLAYMNTGQITGADPDMNPMMMPLFNIANSGRSQLDGGIGVNFQKPSSKLKIAAEVKRPLSQNATGIQMNNNLMGTVGIQYAFGNRHEIHDMYEH